MIGESHFKGDLAELTIATKLAEAGYKIAFPFGQNWRYDLIVVKDDNSLLRVQSKYTDSSKTNGDLITVRCCTRNGKKDYNYTEKDFDFLFVYDDFTKKVYRIPSSVLGSKGISSIVLRSTPPSNGYRKGVRLAADYEWRT